jgi:flagellin
MSLRINTNVAALSARRHLGKSAAKIEHSIRALASGKRIVQAGDDAAGLAISEGLRGQIAGLSSAKSNVGMAVGLMQTAEGSLNEQNNILIRLRELGVQAASDTVSDVEREFLNQEFTQLVEEFDRIAQTTQFGQKKLLVGTGESYEFHVGANAGEENIITYTFDADASASTMGIESLTIDSQDDARDSLEDIDGALEQIGAIRANFGAMQSRFQSAESALGIQIENIEAAKSIIADVDIAFETSELAKSQVQQEAGIAVLAQAGRLPQRVNQLLSVL